jgi:hypothetical protein
MGHDPQMRQLQGGKPEFQEVDEKKVRLGKNGANMQTSLGFTTKMEKLSTGSQFEQLTVAKLPFLIVKPSKNANGTTYTSQGIGLAPWQSLLSYRVTRGSSPKRT